MLTNSSCTIYREKSFERVFIPECFWQDYRGKTVGMGGFAENNSVIIYIPEVYGELAPKLGDMMVRGNCTFTFDMKSEKTVSDGVKTLRTSDPVTVKSIEDKRYGNFCRHIKVVAL